MEAEAGAEAPLAALPYHYWETASTSSHDGDSIAAHYAAREAVRGSHNFRREHEAYLAAGRSFNSRRPAPGNRKPGELRMEGADLECVRLLQRHSLLCPCD